MFVEFGEYYDTRRLVLQRLNTKVIEHTSNPFQLLVLGTGTNDLRILAKVNGGVPRRSSFFCCSCTEEVVQLAKVAEAEEVCG